MEEKIKEEIRRGLDRAEAIKPSEITAAKWLGVKGWLFPRMRAYIDGYREDQTPKVDEEAYKEVFEENGD